MFIIFNCCVKCYAKESFSFYISWHFFLTEIITPQNDFILVNQQNYSGNSKAYWDVPVWLHSMEENSYWGTVQTSNGETGNLLIFSLTKSSQKSVWGCVITNQSHKTPHPKEQTSLPWSKGHDDLEINGRETM